ncbi:hypothetical protein [Vibrio sp. J383]|uniref:hypothetical protein n=1 Tax=Vibrio sp. J383 TaxID=2942997 RepID=UPI0020C0350D|nr:hypothetical protein [Vibrio sp. J383]UQV24936.1 hypothetical protein M4S28_25875 [Vibrio sp. J383]
MSNQFIAINGTRIKRSNIKSFGISSRKKNDSGLFGGLKGLETGEGFWNGFLGMRTINYLYVTTFQNDNYQFTENEIDIKSVIKELESN